MMLRAPIRCRFVFAFRNEDPETGKPVHLQLAFDCRLRVRPVPGDIFPVAAMDPLGMSFTGYKKTLAELRQYAEIYEVTRVEFGKYRGRDILFIYFRIPTLQA